MSNSRIEATSTVEEIIDLEDLEAQVTPLVPVSLNRATKALVGLTMLTNAVCMAGLNTTSLHSLHYPLGFAITSASISIFTELGLSQTFTIPGIEEIAAIVKEGTLPNRAENSEEWPTHLPWITEAAALVISTFCTGVSSYHYGGQVFYWANTLPNEENYHFKHHINTTGWKIFSVLCAGGVVANLLFGQGLETYKVIRRRLSRKSPLSFITFRDIFSFGAGNLLISIPYATAVSLMNIQGSIEAQPFTKLSATLFTTMALTVADASGSYCLNGLFIPQVMHSGLTYLKQPTALNKKQIASLLLAFSLSGLHSYTQFEMALSVLTVLSKNLALEHPVSYLTAITLSLLYAEGEFITASQTLYNGAYALMNAFSRLCLPRQAENLEERQPLLASQIRPSQSGLFATSSLELPINDAISEVETSKQSKSRCTIL